jgi:hypothetical protein
MSNSAVPTRPKSLSKDETPRTHRPLWRLAARGPEASNPDDGTIKAVRCGHVKAQGGMG